MNFQYIWAILKTKKDIPIGLNFQARNLVNTDFIFYPFQYEKNVFTIDLSVWMSNKNDVTKRHEEIIFWPNLIKIKNFIKEKIDSDTKYLLVLSDKPYAQTIDPNNQAPLVDISEVAGLLTDFTILGYDVVDISGLSAIVNIGYSNDEFLDIENAKIEINDFGLYKRCS
jgi:hypothetical protein